jgi:sigma-B regulation protein RsbU (phosphoserine phosphatase)
MAAGPAAALISSNQLPEPLCEEFRRYGFEHLIPVRSKERLIAVLVLGEKLSEAPFTAEDIDFLGSVALQASVAIENAFLYEELAEQERMKQELEIARRIQLASLPQGTPSVPGLEISGRSIPALEVGGDFYDYLPGTGGSVTVVIGDVSGKGTSAALYMSKLQGVLRSLHAFVDSPYELFVRANALLGQGMEKSSYVTALGIMFTPESRSMSVARAGHLPLYRFDRGTREFTRMIPKGLGLALDQTTKFAQELVQETFPCNGREVFLLVSDGITEAMDGAGEQFGEGRIELILAQNGDAPAEAIRDVLFEKVREFAGSEVQHDDQTVVVIKVVS